VNRYLEAAHRLYRHILRTHWNGQAIAGPDPIGKINWRVTRFVKSYTRWLPWKDNLAYLQGQSYWVRDNLVIFEMTDDSTHLDIADQCARFVAERQLANGAWEHPPIRERRGFISTVESVWACLGLISAYRGLDNPSFLDSVLKGYGALVNAIGLVQFRDSLAIKYHAHTKELVPNVTTMLLWLLAEIYKATRDKQYLNHAEKMIRFLEYSQMEDGELQYIYDLRPHFQCFQYNSFQFLDLANYYAITRDERVRTILSGMARFLSSGITECGSCRYDCFTENPETNYWTAALAEALRRAYQLGLGQYQDLSERAYRRLLSRQNAEGGFDFSTGNYGFLSDRQSYPRQQAMILQFLLSRAQDERSTLDDAQLYDT
jgi:hypothetical protein